MFCPKCGKEVNETWGVCPYCGTALPAQMNRTPNKAPAGPGRPPKKNSNILPVILGGVIGILVIIIVIILVVTKLGGSGKFDAKQNLTDVKLGYLGEYDMVPVKTVLENNWPGGGWDSFETDKKQIVEYAGEDRTENLIQFSVQPKKESFEVVYLKKDGEVIESSSDMKWELDSFYEEFSADYPELGIEVDSSQDNDTVKGKFGPVDEPETVKTAQEEKPVEAVTSTPTAVPTFTPIPTATPTPVPTATPVPQQPVNTKTDSTSIIPDSSYRYLAYSDYAAMNNDQKQMAINEIYARHGRLFTIPQVQAYFDRKTWYTGTTAPEYFNEGVFNAYEKANIKTLSDAMTGPSSANPAASVGG